MASQGTSGQLASALITQARSYINEVSAVMASDVEFLKWLNCGTMYIVTQSHCLEDSEELSCVIGQKEYVLVSDYVLVFGVVYEPTSGTDVGLIRGNIQSIGHTVDADTPIHWIPSKTGVIVYPPPSTTAAKIVPHFVKKTADVASGAAVLVPACYDPALVLYMAAQAWFKDGKFAKAGLFMAQCNAEINRYRMDFVTVPKDPIEVVK